MGIAIQELLSQEYFKDFYVLAGAKGLHREIQGITVMEAPDAFHWTKGKELVLSSGYVPGGKCPEISGNDDQKRTISGENTGGNTGAF